MAEYQFKTGDRCDIEQYRMLKRCSEKKDISEWNEWRKNNRREEIWLVGANLQGAHLDGAVLRGAHLEEAHLLGAHLEGADLGGAHLEGADLYVARLEGANLKRANLEGANLIKAHLEGASLQWAVLRGTRACYACVDGKTLLADCHVDDRTDFTCVGLASAQMSPGLRETLEYNIRRKAWQRWYGEGNWLARFMKHLTVRPFWACSDYGRSTPRIVMLLMYLSLLFAMLYCFLGLVWPPHGVIHNFAEGVGGSREMQFVRALYFSIVTMTTLGFGDMHAMPGSFWGHILLTLQVIFGYVLLGALVTRLAVLFTGTGPAVPFTKAPKKPPSDRHNEGERI